MYHRQLFHFSLIIFVWALGSMLMEMYLGSTFNQPITLPSPITLFVISSVAVTTSRALRRQENQFKKVEDWADEMATVLEKMELRIAQLEGTSSAGKS